MIRIILILFLSFPVALCAQTYQQLSEKAIEYIEMDSLSKAEELLLQALKLEPKNAKNAMLFSNLGLVQRRLGEYDKALESYSFALNFAPLAVPILLDRAAINLEMGNTDRAYTDYCQVLDEDKQNKEALLMRAYIYVLRRDYPAATVALAALVTSPVLADSSETNSLEEHSPSLVTEQPSSQTTPDQSMYRLVLCPAL